MMDINKDLIELVDKISFYIENGNNNFSAEDIENLKKIKTIISQIDINSNNPDYVDLLVKVAQISQVLLEIF